MKPNIKVIITLLSISLIFSIVININDNRKIEVNSIQQNTPIERIDLKEHREVNNITTKYHQKNNFHDNATQTNN